MPVCWDVGIVEDQIVPGPLEQPMGSAGDVHSRKGCRELLIRRLATGRWVIRLQGVCVLVSLHLLEDGFSGKGYRQRRHGILVHPLVAAMTRQRAISVSYPRTTGGYGTCGGNAARAYGPKAPRPGHSSVTRQNDAGSARIRMTERRSANSGRTHSQVCAGGCDSYVGKALSPVQRANASSTRGV